MICASNLHFRPGTKNSFLFYIVLFSLALCGCAFGQIVDRSRNNPFSPSPKPKASVEEKAQGVPNKLERPNEPDARQTAARRIITALKPTTVRSTAPMDIYKIAAGDTLFINLLNAPKAAGNFTVGPAGSIDYPLVSQIVDVAGQTTDEIAATLAAGIKLYPDPRIAVKVRAYGSHKIHIAGLV